MQLWIARTQDADGSRLHERFAPFLTPEELARYHGFHRDSDRHLYLLAHCLMRVALLPHAPKPMKEWIFTPGEKGKPQVDLGAGVNPHFSLSHTAGIAVCAVSGSGPIGVDVESVQRGKEALGIARNWCTESEHRFLQQQHQSRRDETAIWLWTTKEALLKATGEGIGSLASVSVQWPIQPGASPTVETDAPWTLRRLRFGEEYVGAIARAGHLDQGAFPEVFEWKNDLKTPCLVHATEANGIWQIASAERP